LQRLANRIFVFAREHNKTGDVCEYKNLDETWEMR
jgi:hypothetical protein